MGSDRTPRARGPGPQARPLALPPSSPPPTPHPHRPGSFLGSQARCPIPDPRCPAPSSILSTAPDPGRSCPGGGRISGHTRTVGDRLLRGTSPAPCSYDALGRSATPARWPRRPRRRLRWAECTSVREVLSSDRSGLSVSANSPGLCPSVPQRGQLLRLREQRPLRFGLGKGLANARSVRARRPCGRTSLLRQVSPGPEVRSGVSRRAFPSSDTKL